MRGDQDSKVFSLLQPDLLTVEDLIRKIQSVRESIPLNKCYELINFIFNKLQHSDYKWKYCDNRCCRIKNLELMSKEELVGLFRRVILPLPQRFYRTNRRGKMLSSCRAKAGLEIRRKDEGCSQEKSHKASASNSHLKPSLEKSDFRKIQINSNQSEKNLFKSRSLETIIIKDKRKLNGDDRREDEGRKSSKIPRPGSPSGKIIILKRSSNNEQPPTQSELPTESKRQRTIIKWP